MTQIFFGIIPESICLFFSLYLFGIINLSINSLFFFGKSSPTCELCQIRNQVCLTWHFDEKILLQKLFITIVLQNYFLQSITRAAKTLALDLRHLLATMDGPQTSAFLHKIVHLFLPARSPFSIDVALLYIQRLLSSCLLSLFSFFANETSLFDSIKCQITLFGYTSTALVLSDLLHMLSMLSNKSLSDHLASSVLPSLHLPVSKKVALQSITGSK